ncbi:MAG: type II/IV secretion system protein, partial [Gammaproteobacteria bacterium]
MSAARTSAKTADHRLSFQEVLDWLEADGLASGEKVTLMRSLAERGAYKDKHPVTIIGKRGWQDERAPHPALTPEALTAWLATKVDLPYLRIDPLKLDVQRITSVVSLPYASRFNVLPVAVTATEITVATAEPHQREWEREIGQVQNKKIRRVFANPEEIARYLVEFYSISRSVLGAERQNEGLGGSGLQNLDQLMELGRAGKLDANDQHVVSIVDWLLQYAFDQRASDIHIEPRREEG